MSKRFIIVFTCIAAMFLLPFTLLAQQKILVEGVVKDSVTQEPLPFVSVYMKGTTTGTMSDDDGRFYIDYSGPSRTLAASSLGYNERSFTVEPGHVNKLTILMSPTSYALAEVIVRPQNAKYSKKNNPAVEFVEKMIAHRNENSPKNHDYYSYERYEKITFALNDFTEERKKNWLFKKFDFIFDYVDTSEVSGKPILNISNKELLEDVYYRKSPFSEKRLVKAIKSAGVDEILSQEGVQQFLGEVFKEIDIYQNDIPLFLNRFVSPLSRIGTSFYKYYLNDTLTIEGERCVNLSFIPFNTESFGFTGQLYVTLDSTYFVKRVMLDFPTNINLNFVENMSVQQTFDRAPDGTRLLTRDDIVVEFKLTSKSKGLYAHRTTVYSDFSFEPPEDMSIFDNPAKVIEQEDARKRDDEYWAENRMVPTTGKENIVNLMMARLRQVPVFYYGEKVVSVLITGYIPTAKKDSKFEFGPMNTTISGNSLEGARFRVGGSTMAALSRNFFANGYLAYGTKDEKFKYDLNLEYSFDKKKEHPNEFPIHSVRLYYSYDVNQLGQHYLYTSKDNVFLALKRAKDDKITYLRQTGINYMREFYSGFSYDIGIKYSTEYATKFIPFDKIQADGSTLPIKDYSMSTAIVKLRYAPNEKFYQTRDYRVPITLDAPVFTLSHEVGVKSVLGSAYNYNRTDVGIMKRFWFSAFGYTDIILLGGKVWNKVPFPLLIIPNANLSYTIQPESYSLLNAMEFINDQYASWDVTYFVNGALLNRIPFIKKLKWREVFFTRGFWGDLSKKNNPEYGPEGVFLFPQGSYKMGKKPYVEVGAGVENIFKVLRLDYVWRLTYRDHPDISKSGLRVSLHFTF
ncbi:DUF5686 and carboxypeptidase-like regulatory domain-containing protein [Parabacteroides pacaensis]|uniref:DUF5686 and carboxypeptidase-like regulatory domain-containing protein n=1 Tax=Parabacteroides pacaensis TaxID=2086575 RepID=UPI000D0F5E76|nr:DUF5686 and carboxypeptidase-like regulatory domain-containing protein [Parabacteroides pacaensis]